MNEYSGLLSIFGVVIANLGTVIAFYLHLDKKLDENRKETNEILKGIAFEMKDFHGKLCAIEERNHAVREHLNNKEK